MNIRYVHIPDEIDMRAAIDQEVNREWRMRDKMTREIRDAAKKRITKRQLQAEKEKTLRRKQAELEEKKKINLEDT